MRIVLGVGGGIAAYKAALLLRLMTEAGHEVTVVPTRNAEHFVGRATWEALSGRPVHTDTFDAVDRVNHVALGRSAELVVVAPATADLLARTAAGMAPDLLGNVLLTATCPVVLAPAMHTEMWQHAATQANVATLRERGVYVLDPAVGRLTGADSGAGRLPEPEQIWDAARALIDGAAVGPLTGRRVVVTGGGTREPLDPVRYLGNRSSGKQAVALARAAVERGAEVTLIAGPMSTPVPTGIRRVDVETTQQLLETVLEHARGADVLVMAAAVADFRPRTVATAKIKKDDDGSSPTIELERTPDVLASAVAARAEGAPIAPLIVGFAAETGDEDHDVLEHAQAKLKRKGCEMLVVNDVSAGQVFGRDETAVTVLFADGSEPVTAVGTKDDAARTVLERVVTHLG
ncbi:phosphopantothenoylcysteine decarboxylase/phosphopantothenate--cysteine ligase [Micrococcus cohnii]|uniref:Coenzyme A biosynthesis bifunctional protein CoaBC n=1 Tax=Micrococcus cohnii TaxID=993416 RepID=A0A7W7GNH9_9MICC|nr:bifunctional phosphopantothenoylcysteine decarboxylase/phosphopantothenate--cysteine ligase CoaBC [Micrococcus cohnii]MBB4735326.1 phosphopantothenoylcysteine decarboxylase/phosphopantothenate--cysteine ligase [Micrococcus cohnii]